MAVYTYLHEDDWKQIAGFYGFFSISNPIAIAEGVENSNYCIHLHRQPEEESIKAIATIFEQRVDASDLPFFLSLKQHLRARGISCPAPFTTAEGYLYTAFKDKHLAIVSFLDGKSIYQPAIPHIMQAASTLAQMHLASADFSLRRKNAMSFDGWYHLRQRIANAASHEHQEILALIEDELAFQEIYWPYELPKGIIHADLFPNNVFFDTQEQLSGVIDFYFACYDVLAYDLAILINAWCFDKNHQFQPEAAIAAVDAYHAVRPLSMEEKEALPVLLRAGAMRFLLTRLHDVLYHDPAALLTPHDPREYAIKLRFHQQRPFPHM